MSPQTNGVAKLMQCRGLKRGSAQVGRHQNIYEGLTARLTCSGELADTEVAAAIAGSPTGRGLTTGWATTPNDDLRLGWIVDTLQRQESRPAIDGSLHSRHPTQAPSIGLRLEGLNPNAPVGQ